MNKQLRVFTSVWGDQHIDWFKKYCLQSLSWPKNRDCLDGATWTFLTLEDDVPKIEAALKESGIQIENINFMLLPKNFNPHQAGSLINEGLLIEMQNCIMYNTKMLLAPPDTIFGNGSIRSMLEVARQRDSVVFAVHARVNPTIEATTEMSNAKLVTAAFKNLHKTWSEAVDGGREKVNSYIGGVSWKWVGDGLYAVTHRLPTPYVFNWTPEDIVYFKNQLHWGTIDHSWPHECLVHTERMRVIGSSDAAFMVEITPENENIPPVAAYHENEPDLFWRNLSHNKVNRMFSVILRGED